MAEREYPSPFGLPKIINCSYEISYEVSDSGLDHTPCPQLPG